MKKDMKLVVYRPSDGSKIGRAYRQNEGVDTALDRLEQLRWEDPNITIVDGNELSEHERDLHYIRAAAVTGSFTRHAVRKIFGRTSIRARCWASVCPQFESKALRPTIRATFTLTKK